MLTLTCARHGERDREVEARAPLAQGGGREVDRDLPVGRVSTEVPARPAAGLSEAAPKRAARARTSPARRRRRPPTPRRATGETVRSCIATSRPSLHTPRLHLRKLLRPVCWKARPDPAYRSAPTRTRKARLPDCPTALGASPLLRVNSTRVPAASPHDVPALRHRDGDRIRGKPASLRPLPELVCLSC